MKLTPSTNTRLRKAVEIVTDPAHPQHRLLVDLVDTAVELDPPAGFVEGDHDGLSVTYTYTRHLTVVPPDGGAA